MSAIDDIAAERRRQIEVEGWTPEHDDSHSDGQLVAAAISYAYSGWRRIHTRPWPWEPSWWKPTTPRRDLVKSGALIAAEIDRLDRLAASS